MGCWSRSWFEAALSRQAGRQSVLKTQRNRVHLPSISAGAAAPGAGLGAAEPLQGTRARSAATGTRLGQKGDGGTWACPRPALAGENHCTPVPPQSSLGWCLGARVLLPSMGLLIQSRRHQSRCHQDRRVPAQGTFPFPEQRGYWAASWPALGSLCGLPERGRGKETADECEEWTGGSRLQSCGGTSTAGLFAWKSP